VLVPKPPTFDATAWRDRLKEAIPKRPDGTPIKVWDQLPPLAAWWSKMRDISQTHDIQLADQKRDLDLHGQAIIELRADVQALKEAPAARPFP
jgi:hypothetical protein